VKYALVVVIFALYGICGAVLLINLLIAMMGNTYSQLQDKSRLAYEYENCRLFLFYDAHLGLPSPLNLLPFCAHPFVRLASWMRSKATAQAGGLVEDKPQDQQYCRHCLLNLSNDDHIQGGAAIFCRRCARHGTALSSTRRDHSRLQQQLWEPIAFVGVLAGLVVLEGVQYVGSGVFAAWSSFVELLLSSRKLEEIDAPTDSMLRLYRHKSRFNDKSVSKRKSVNTQVAESLELAKQAQYALQQRENLGLIKGTVLKDMLVLDNVPCKEEVDFVNCVMNLDQSLK